MLTLIRTAKDEKSNAIRGSLFLNGAFLCCTLENLAKAVPVGSYALSNSISPKFKRELPLLSNPALGVSVTRGIRIHSGNTSKDAAGCVLVGMRLGATAFSLAESKPAEQLVMLIARNHKELEILQQY